MKKVLPLHRYIFIKVSPYILWISALTAFMTGIIFSGMVVISTVQMQKNIAQAVSSQVASLVDIFDRPELLRFMNSIARDQNIIAQVIYDDKILATSGSTQNIDKPYAKEKPIVDVRGSIVSKKYLTTTIPAKRLNGLQSHALVEIKTPLKPILLNSLTVFISIFLFMFLSLKLLGRGLAVIIKRSIKPVENLDQGIKCLAQYQDENKMNQSEILELENIRQSILYTHRALLDARDEIAQGKAKELVADGYKRLLHDLNTPITAMRELAKQSVDENNDQIQRTQIACKIPELAEQILNQIHDSLVNLELEPKTLEAEDIRQTVDDATEEARLANNKKIIINKNLPIDPVIYPHSILQLKRAVSNLVANAIQHGQEKIQVDVEDLGKQVIIRVSDDGLGVDKNTLKLHLQGRGRSSRRASQSIGLSSVNYIAKTHGGRVVAKESIYGGACFEIRI